MKKGMQLKWEDYGFAIFDDQAQFKRLVQTPRSFKSLPKDWTMVVVKDSDVLRMARTFVRWNTKR